MPEDRPLLDPTIRNYFAEMKRFLSSNVGKVWLFVLLGFLCFPLAIFWLLTKPLPRMDLPLWAKLSIGVVAGSVSILAFLAMLLLLSSPVEVDMLMPR